MTTPLCPLYELADVQSGLPVRSLVSREAGGGALVFALMPASLKNDAEISPDLEMLVPALADGNPEERYRVKPGDIFITAKSTEASMRCCLISSDWKPQLSPYFASSLIRIQPTSRKNLLPRYLHAWLASPDGKAALLAESQSATSQLNLTTSSISRVNVPVPSLEQQHKVVELLNAAFAAHDSAIAAAESRLLLAHEVAFRTMKTSSPRILIQKSNPAGQLLVTENIDGSPEPNTCLWSDVRKALDALPVRQLTTLLDPHSMETMHLDRSGLATRLAQELRNFLAVCASDSNQTIQIIGKDPTIDLDFFIANKLGIIPGKQSVSQLLLSLDYLPPEAGQQVQIHLE